MFTELEKKFIKAQSETSNAAAIETLTTQVEALEVEVTDLDARVTVLEP